MSAVYDTGKAVWNSALGTVEAIPNLMSGAVPGGPDYAPFLNRYRAQYDTPAFGSTIEFITGVGAVKVFGDLRASSAGYIGGVAETGGAKGVNAAEREATGFLGSAGNELKNSPYQSVRNEASQINGRDFSAHAIDQMQNRGVIPSVVENALHTGTEFQTRTGTTGMYDAVNNVRVIVNSETGRVVTVIRGAPR
jgi:hypothetical protein